MFDLPIALSNKRLRAARKLRYEYCNNLRQKYSPNQGMIDHGLPTPENSATEASETEEMSQRKRKRIRRRWKSILGESYSDCESDDDWDESFQTNDNVDNPEEDQERIFFRKYEKPQCSFEKWQTDPKRRIPIQRNKISFSKLNRLQKLSQRSVEKSLTFASRKNKEYFNVIRQGLEYVDPQLGKNDSFHVKHIRTLSTLLQVHVSRHNWELAYKCFTLLIRIPKVDIRNLWGIGEHILAKKEPLKSFEFLEWINGVYSSRVTFCEEINYQTPPVFTRGSKTNVPKYTLTLLWNSLLLCTRDTEGLDRETHNKNDRLTELMEKISELVLAPPYMEEAEIWFIYALCHMLKADKLSSQFNQDLIGSARDIASNQVFQHIQSSKSFLQTCASKGNFYFPGRYIERQLESFERRLQELEPHQPMNDSNIQVDDYDIHYTQSEDELSDRSLPSD